MDFLVIDYYNAFSAINEREGTPFSYIEYDDDEDVLSVDLHFGGGFHFFVDLRDYKGHYNTIRFGGWGRGSDIYKAFKVIDCKYTYVKPGRCNGRFFAFESRPEDDDSFNRLVEYLFKEFLKIKSKI